MIITPLSSAIMLVMSLQAANNEGQVAEPAQEAQAEQAEASEAEKITDRSHPDYIRCKREPVIGSRAKFTKRCMTNRQWAEANYVGNREARRMVEDLQVGSNSN